MGLLKVGTPKSWDDSKKDLRYIRRAGVNQFISTYNRVKHFKGDNLLWGDEIEYGIFKLDDQGKKVRIALRGKEVMDELNRKEKLNEDMAEGCTFVPEYGAWMVESTPGRPYTGYTSDLLRVERNMRLRRKRMLTVLGENEVAPTMSSFPMLGAMGNDGSVPPTKVGGPITLSDYIGDGIINPHPRFGTLTANIRQRRGEKVNIRVPLFRDVNTPEFDNYHAPAGDVDGCCGSDSQQLWRYGKGDPSQEKYGNDLLVVGCSTNSRDEQFQDGNSVDMVTLQKWLVDVNCEGCRGLFYRSAPNVIVPDADWPRNGDIVVGSEIQDVPGWIRLQNGYYLPMHSDDTKIQFLHKVSTRTNPSNPEMKRIGSGTPLFRAADQGDTSDIASLLAGKLSVENQTSDTATVSTEEATSVDTDESRESVRAAIHMDAMAFGMGCCCLQITFQGKDIDESRFMYDQLAVLAPIMMALTASTPFLKGRIADTDARWGIISESVDDRTLAERGRIDPDAPHDVLSGLGQRRLYKSRYDCISTYIYQGAFFPGDEVEANKSGLANRVLNNYNDIPVPIAEESYQMLREAGIDPALSQHVAHLFARDPLVIFEGAVEEVDDETQTEHWESIQSTNWQSVRWKPPPPRNSPNDPHIGWRTEFRSMELQLTDFENAAFTAFTVLLTRVILTFDLNLYIPLSRVDSNMQRAHSRNAAAKGKFFFRRHMAPLEEGDDGYGVRYNSMFSRAVNGDTPASSANSTRGADDLDAEGVSRQRRTAPFAPGSNEENAYEEMTMAEIMCGKGDYFPGLIPLVQAYLDYINCDSITRTRLDTYLDFIEKRATGELVTPATWMRNYVRTHPAYKGDSVITDEIAYDLVKICSDIGLGKVHIPELLGDVVIDPITTEGAYEVKLDSRRAKNGHILELLTRYKSRESFKSTTTEAAV
eukprot:CAMPEP_0119008490 /NCGR_PEP_ID=MMETSP1176-20130426/3727_1 /TAXON_ID=265551 /ORGANISM="Synedropsis recta cf, Strain CCMP1620" /LENGTH=929 /DNA_ID=CAMNT_0006960827 /DNA_START=65 /DNA_END=2854 /DNA_ORIENTATION=-